MAIMRLRLLALWRTGKSKGLAISVLPRNVGEDGEGGNGGMDLNRPVPTFRDPQILAKTELDKQKDRRHRHFKLSHVFLGGTAFVFVVRSVPHDTCPSRPNSSPALD